MYLLYVKEIPSQTTMPTMAAGQVVGKGQAKKVH